MRVTKKAILEAGAFLGTDKDIFGFLEGLSDVLDPHSNDVEVSQRYGKYKVKIYRMTKHIPARIDITYNKERTVTHAKD